MPLTIPLTTSFHRDRQIISIIIMMTMGQKYKKIAKGEINIYKKYFQGDNVQTEKWVYLTLFQTQLENMGHNTDIIKAELNKGKIYMKLTLLQPISQFKDVPLTKEPIQANKTERYRSIVENSNEFLKKIKNKKPNEIMEDLYEDINKSKEFDDGLSDLSISIIDTEDEEKKEALDLKGLVTDDMLLYNLKKSLEMKGPHGLPRDLDKLKQLNEVLLSKFLELSKSYNESLTTYNSQNEELRQKAKKIYEEYKEIKKEVYKGRVELKKKNEELKKDIATNAEQNKKLSNDINSIKTELKYFKHEMGIEQENENEKKKDDSEINFLSNVLLKIYSEGYDIFSGSNLSLDERTKLKYLLKIGDGFENNPNEEDEDLGDDHTSNMIVGLIENDVNDLYMKKRINNVKIDQINVYTYNFEDMNNNKQVTLTIVNNELVTSTGAPFTEWLLENFGSGKGGN